jgi:hypothetical protein
VQHSRRDRVDHRYRRLACDRAHLFPDSQRLDHGLLPIRSG